MRSKHSKLLQSTVIGPLAAMIIIFIIAAITTNRFLSIQNIANQLMQVCVITIISIGETIIIITGGIDISCGAGIGLMTMVLAVLIAQLGIPVWFAIILVLLGGILIGLINGTIVAYLRIPAFITTLATQGIFRGLSYILNAGAPIEGVKGNIDPIFYGNILGIPIVVIYIVVLYTLAYLFLKYVKTGRHIYAIGGNTQSARLSGINIKSTLLKTYVISGLLVSAASVVMFCRLDSGSQSYGSGMELYAIAAAVIGGTSLAGGKGNVISTFIGSIIIVIVQNALNLHAVPIAVQQIAVGIVITLAVLLDMWRDSFANAIKKLFNIKSISQ